MYLKIQDHFLYLDVGEKKWSVAVTVRPVNVVSRHALQEQVEHLHGVVITEPGQHVER